MSPGGEGPWVLSDRAAHVLPHGVGGSEGLESHTVLLSPENY